MTDPQTQIATAFVAKVQDLLQFARIATAEIKSLEVNRYSESVTTLLSLDLGGKTILRLYLDEPRETSK